MNVLVIGHDADLSSRNQARSTIVIPNGALDGLHALAQHTALDRVPRHVNRKNVGSRGGSFVPVLLWNRKLDGSVPELWPLFQIQAATVHIQVAEITRFDLILEQAHIADKALSTVREDHIGVDICFAAAATSWTSITKVDSFNRCLKIKQPVLCPRTRQQSSKVTTPE